MSDPNREGLDDVINELRASGRVTPSFDERVMRAVRQLPRVRRLTVWSRMMMPRTIRFVPLPTAALAASLVVAAAIVGGLSGRATVVRHALRDSMAAVARVDSLVPSHRSVQFVLVAPAAHKVAVAGDFNDWNPSHAAFVAHHNGGGVWSVTADIPAGHHRYSFVVDDTMWVADPAAPRVPDDDFGQPASALVVNGGGM